MAILLVVVGHFIQENSVQSASSPLFGWIYGFHMPLFMFISGYMAFKTTRVDNFTDFLSFLKNRSLGLLVPYFAWPLIVDNFFFTSHRKSDLLEVAVDLTHKWNHLWFLWYLFFLLLAYVAFYAISNLINKKRLLLMDIIVTSFIMAILAVIKFFRLPFPADIDSFLLYFIFFFTGIFISKYPLLSGLILNKFTFSLVLLIFFVFSGRYNYVDTSSMNKVIKMVVSMTAIASLYYLANTIVLHPYVEKYLRLWGRNSIVIYTTHFTMIKFLAGFTIMSNLFLLPMVLISLIGSIIIITACMAVLSLVELNPLLNLILYGHRDKKAKKA